MLEQNSEFAIPSTGSCAIYVLLLKPISMYFIFIFTRVPKLKTFSQFGLLKIKHNPADMAHPGAVSTPQNVFDILA